MAFKIIPIERKRSIPIDILESLQAYIWFAGCLTRLFREHVRQTE